MRFLILLLFFVPAHATLPPLDELQPAPVLRISRVGAHLVFARCQFDLSSCEHLSRMNTEQLMKLRDQLQDLTINKIPRTGIPPHRKPEIEHKAHTFAVYSTLALASMTFGGYAISSKIGPVFTFGTLAIIAGVLGTQVWEELHSIRQEQQEAYRMALLTTFDDAFSALQSLTAGQTRFVALPYWFWRELDESLHTVSK